MTKGVFPFRYYRDRPILKFSTHYKIGRGLLMNSSAIDLLRHALALNNRASIICRSVHSVIFAALRELRPEVRACGSS